MTSVIEVPAQFDDRTFDQFVKEFEGTSGRVLFDAHATQWASPYGLLGLLAAGQFAAEQGGQRPLLTIPQDREVDESRIPPGLQDARFGRHRVPSDR